jgi:hypothetical protein
VQPSEKAPAPSAAERIASTPVESTDQPKTADVATPAQTETPSPDSQPVPEDPAAAPEKTVTAVVPDAKPTEDNAPQLAPTSSPRPPARPKPVDTPPAPTKTADPAPTPAPADTSAADQAAIDAALANATAADTAPTSPQPSQSGSGGTGDQPIGAALNSGEIDSLRRGEGGRYSDNVDRDALWRVQTPQAFRTPAILAAHRAAASGATDEVAIALAAGLRVAITPGDERAFKVTEPADFAKAEAMTTYSSRAASGFDVHKFGPGDHVWLCGIKVPHDHGLIAWSRRPHGIYSRMIID